MTRRAQGQPGKAAPEASGGREGVARVSPRHKGWLLLVSLALAAACGSAERRLDAANALRHAGDSKGALAAYKVILADLGDGPLPAANAAVRWKALRFAGDVSYLELGDYGSAISYYRRIVSLHPGGKEAYEARGVIGDIYRDRFKDHLAAITQYAEVAASDSPLAPNFQLEVARGYLALGSTERARAEARVLREKWPQHELAEEAQLLTAQAWALEKKDDEALGAFQALVDREPRPEMKARALEGQAHLHAQAGRFDRALELYALALPTHPNPDAIRTHIEAVRERREKAKTAKPGDRAAAFDERKVKPSPREEP
ncbi:MAG TPA: tetratricopeptide repeat protein [Anaeromyxobacter sp.]